LGCQSMWANKKLVLLISFLKTCEKGCKGGIMGLCLGLGKK
jgi:hypothetical protein